MSPSAALPPPPARQHADQETDISQVRSQRLEDLRLAERIERALRATGHRSLRAVAVAVCARVVILGGRVPSYYLKQLAQATALAVPGAHHIRNDLHVVQPTSESARRVSP